MKFALKWIGAVLIGLLALLIVGGWLLKPGYRVERSLLVNAPAEQIYAHLDSSDGWQRWGVWYRRDPQMKVKASGSALGTGAAWDWTSDSQGNGRMLITAAETGRRVAYELRIDDFNPSSGELRLEPETGGTRVIWLMQGDMGGNPINRWFGLFMDKLVGPDFEAGLAKLKQLAEKS
jgi:hypothetical protein